MIKAVLFDFYDTLVNIRTDDWGDDAMRGVASFLRYHGVVLHRAECRQAARDALKRQIDRQTDPNVEHDLEEMWSEVLRERAPSLVAELEPTGLARFATTLSRIQRSQSRVRFNLRPDAIRVLRALQEKYRLGILANGHTAFVIPELRELEIETYFEVVITSGQVGVRKPDPRMFVEAARVLGMPPSAIVHVGSDRDRDGRSAARAGVASITIGHRRSAARLHGVEVRTVRELNDVPRGVAEITANQLASPSRDTPRPATEVVSSPSDLQSFTQAIFVATGTPLSSAAEVARHLVRANLAGHDSHGVMRIPQYVNMIREGQVVPSALPSVIAEHGATVVVDGGGTFGQVTGAFALAIATARVSELGTVIVAMRNANHLGRIGDYAEIAAARGHVAIVTVGAVGPGVGGAAPFGGAEAFLSTNPWAFGFPSTPNNSVGVLVDFATTVIPEGKVRYARDARKPLPAGTILDANGNPSTDPNDFYAGGVLLPLGGENAGHKGYGLALASALLGALGAIGQSEPNLVGALPPSGGFGGTTAGAVLILIDPAAFGDSNAYRQTIDEVTEAARKVRTTPGVAQVLVPGDPEAIATKSRQAGIHVPAATWEMIRGVAAELAVPLPPTKS